MGILNVTPDSFSDGGRFADVESALAHARAMKAAGADFIDVGGESTRPGAAEVPVDEELARVLPVIERLRAEGLGPISVDTRKARVMREAATAGADLINDVSALTFDPGALPAAAETGLPVVLMHAQGTPETMQKDPRYKDAVAEVHAYLADRIAACVSAGIGKDKIVIDPGIGFGKTLQHNLELLANLARFDDLGCPLLLGASRKSFIQKIEEGAGPDDRLGGSLAAAAAGLEQGVKLFRVHDVAESAQFIRVWLEIMRNRK
jgi:dihydropteroate synthase